MRTTIHLENNQLLVTAHELKRDIMYNGQANIHLPDWTSRQAILAIIDAALVEAEAQMRKRMSYE